MIAGEIARALENKGVRRFAFLIGGFGQNQYNMPQAALAVGAEAIILGEMGEFDVIACLELGLLAIESLYSASEEPGIRAQARVPAQRLAGVQVEYVPSGALGSKCATVCIQHEKKMKRGDQDRRIDSDIVILTHHKTK
jgi:putative NIF3 family GTP cyclohydrolase 1 type 2